MKHVRNWRGLGTDLQVIVVSPDSNGALTALDAVMGLFRSVEAEFSRFRPDSSLSVLNRTRELEVSSRFVDLLRLSLDMHDRTDGSFNPLVDVASLGYSSTFDSGSFVPLRRETHCLDVRGITIDGRRILLAEWCSLDFGGIGKGWAVDLAAEMLRQFGFDDFCVNAGWDVRTSGHSDSGVPWIVGIEHPTAWGVFATVSLSGKAIATSGPVKRNWTVSGERHHHLVDPRTWKNREGVSSVTVIADRCAIADAYTKAVFNLPTEEALAFMEARSLEGCILTAEGQCFYTKRMLEFHDFRLS